MRACACACACARVSIFYAAKNVTFNTPQFSYLIPPNGYTFPHPLVLKRFDGPRNYVHLGHQAGFFEHPPSICPKSSKNHT